MKLQFASNQYTEAQRSIPAYCLSHGLWKHTNCIWDLVIQSHSASQPGLGARGSGGGELEAGRVLVEALTVLCTEWLFSRQLTEVAAHTGLFESPKGYAAASSKSSKSSMCQGEIKLFQRGQRLWSLHSIDGIWIKE